MRFLLLLSLKYLESHLETFHYDVLFFLFILSLFSLLLLYFSTFFMHQIFPILRFYPITTDNPSNFLHFFTDFLLTFVCFYLLFPAPVPFSPVTKFYLPVHYNLSPLPRCLFPHILFFFPFSTFSHLLTFHFSNAPHLTALTFSPQLP